MLGPLRIESERALDPVMSQRDRRETREKPSTSMPCAWIAGPLPIGSTNYRSTLLNSSVSRTEYFYASAGAVDRVMSRDDLFNVSRAVNVI